VRLIKKIKDESLPIKITYDSGNSSGRGYDPKEEIDTYGEEITNVHIKDRLKGNGTKNLGEGSADFDTVFAKLKEKKYLGDFILQVARGEDFKEEETVASQIEFVKKYLKKYFND
jgi:hexulose-6-phosphate isomerase